jgi:hypothetical protein
MADWSNDADWSNETDWSSIGVAGEVLLKIQAEGLSLSEVDLTFLVQAALVKVQSESLDLSETDLAILVGFLVKVVDEGVSLSEIRRFVLPFAFGESTGGVITHEDPGPHFWAGMGWNGIEFFAGSAGSQSIVFFGHDGDLTDLIDVSGGNAIWGVAFDGTDYWVSDALEDQLNQYSTAGALGTLIDTIDTAVEQPRRIAFDGTHMWAASALDLTLIYLVDLSDGSTVGTIPSPDTDGIIRAMEFFDGHLWVITDTDPTGGTDFLVWKLDPSDGAVVSSFPVNELVNPSAMGFDGQYLWIADLDDELFHAYAVSSFVFDTIKVESEDMEISEADLQLVEAVPVATGFVGWGIPL